LIYANVVWPITNYSGVNAVPYGYGIQQFYWEPWTSILNAAGSPALAFGVAAFLIIPFLFIAAVPAIGALVAIFRKRQAPYSLTLPYWIAGGAVWLSEIHRKDITHLVYGSLLLIIPCFYYLARQRHRLCVYAVQIICISTFALAAFNGFIAMSASTKMITRRGTFYAFRRDPVLEFVSNHVKPGSEIFAYPYCPEYYFLSGASNPTPFSILMYHINTNAQFRDAVRSLEEKKVRYVIWHREFSETAKHCWPAYSLPRKEQLIVEPYLADRYQVCKRIGGFDILERRNDSPAPQMAVPATAKTASAGTAQ
jgi:hypothetical protein